MKCYECNTQMEVIKGNYAYQASKGLTSITLQNINIGRCPQCGKESTAIPKMQQLHQAIALAIAKKKARLLPPEIRFLRKYLGWSGADFAKQFSVTPETISRWENGKTPMGPTADKLLRMCAIHLDPIDDYSTQELQELGSEEAKPVRFLMSVVDEKWQSEEFATN